MLIVIAVVLDGQSDNSVLIAGQDIVVVQNNLTEVVQVIDDDLGYTSLALGILKLDIIEVEGSLLLQSVQGVGILIAVIGVVVQSIQLDISLGRTSSILGFEGQSSSG